MKFITDRKFYLLLFLFVHSIIVKGQIVDDKVDLNKKTQKHRIILFEDKEYDGRILKMDEEVIEFKIQKGTKLILDRSSIAKISVIKNNWSNKNLSKNKKNEINFNLGTGIMKLAEFEVLLEVSYERLFKLPKLPNSSIGLHVGSTLDSDDDITILLAPYYRLYSGKQSGSGLFLEGSLFYFREKTLINMIFCQRTCNPLPPELTTENALGVAGSIGAKLVKGRGWTGELLIGAGYILNRGIFESYFGSYEKGLPRIGLSIGKRF